MTRSTWGTFLALWATFAATVPASSARAAGFTSLNPTGGIQPGLVSPKSPGGTAPLPGIDLPGTRPDIDLTSPRPGIDLTRIGFDRTITPPASGPRDVIVELDAAALRKSAEALRKRKKLDFDDKQIRDMKKTGYKKLRKSFATGIQPLGVKVVRTFENFPVVVVHIDEDADVAALERRADVAAVYENLYFSPTLAQSLPQVGQPAAAAQGARGAGTTVAVLDSGVDFTLPAFGSCTAPGQPATCRVRAAGEFAFDDGALDDDGHGTNVAGIVLGMAPAARILALDVFDGTFGRQMTNVVGLAAAIDFVIATKFQFNTVAMNLSLGTEGIGSPGRCISPVDPLFAEAQAIGIMPIVAAGNDGNPNRTSIPACSPFAVSVGAVTTANAVAGFSNSSRSLDLLAPGTEITAAGITMQGTSQATPHVAGAWAVMRAARPGLSLSQTLQALKDTGPAVIDARQGRVVPRIRIDAAINWQPRFVLPVSLENLGDLAGIEIDWVNCQAQELADGLACGYEQVAETITDAVECGVRTVTSAAQCGFDTVTSAVQCGVDTITGALDDLLSDFDIDSCSCNFTTLSCTCEFPATCQVPASCQVANTCEILRACDPNTEECEALTCEVELCEF
jgi:subtilisin family serine protease